MFLNPSAPLNNSDYDTLKNILSSYVVIVEIVSAMTIFLEICYND